MVAMVTRVTLQDIGYYLRVDVAGVVTIQGGCVTVLRHLDIAWGQGRLIKM